MPGAPPVLEGLLIEWRCAAMAADCRQGYTRDRLNERLNIACLT
jgi:hypothetical protein